MNVIGEKTLGYLGKVSFGGPPCLKGRNGSWGPQRDLDWGPEKFGARKKSGNISETLTETLGELGLGIMVSFLMEAVAGLLMFF